MSARGAKSGTSRGLSRSGKSGDAKRRPAAAVESSSELLLGPARPVARGERAVTATRPRSERRSAAASSRSSTRPAARGKRSEARLLDDTELDTIERQHEGGMTLAQVIEAFTRRGVHLSEASFRKYVQLGLLGRSRRVGRKGRHQGSLGVYPATTVRRICAIKRMMAARYTIEDIQRSFLRFTEEVEGLRRALERLFGGFERELGAGDFPGERRRAIARELSAAQKLSAELVQQVESLERQLVSPLERAARARAVGAGQKGGADDLL